MATDILFPFFEILVNRIFGSVGLSLVALGLVFIAMFSLARSGWTFIIFWLMLYVATMLTFYVGAMGMVIMIILGGIYFFTQVVRTFFPER